MAYRYAAYKSRLLALAFAAVVGSSTVLTGWDSLEPCGDNFLPRVALLHLLGPEGCYQPCNEVSVEGRLLPRFDCAAVDPRAVANAESIGLLRPSRQPLIYKLLAQNKVNLQELESFSRGFDPSASDASDWAELAAVQGTAGLALDSPEEVLKALDSIERALEPDGQRPEYHFIRAWLLELLSLRLQAASAWRQYLELDKHSKWRSEARARFDLINDPSSVANVADLQAGREQILEQSLVAWARAWLSKEDSQSLLRNAESRAWSLLVRGAGRSAVDTVAAIQRSVESGDASSAIALAQALVAYDAGRRELRELRLESAHSSFEEARKWLVDEHGVPLKLWVDLEVGELELQRRDFEAAEATFQEIIDAVAGRSYLVLEGRALLGWGLSSFRQGFLSRSLEPLERAAVNFEAAHEPANQALAYNFLAECFDSLGQQSRAWRYRYLAGRRLASGLSSQQMHHWLSESSFAAQRQGFSRAALAFQNEGVQVAELSGNSVVLCESLAWRSKILLSVNRSEDARKDLLRAQKIVSRIAPGESRRRLTLDLLYATAAFERELDPVRLFTTPAAVRRDSPAIAGGEAVGDRARALTSRGQLRKAAADLDRGISLFEQQRDAIRDPDLLRFFVETGQDLFEQRIRLHLALGEEVAAFYLAERARWFSAGHPSAAEGNSPHPQDLLGSLGSGKTTSEVAWVSYFWSSDLLVAWVIHQGRVKTTTHVVDFGELDRLIRVVSRDLQNSGRSPESDELSALLLPSGLLALPERVSFRFVPDKGLAAVPFSALPLANGQRLVESRSVSILPSLRAQWLVSQRYWSRNGRAPEGATLAGDPAFESESSQHSFRLPGAKAEIQAIEPLYGSTVSLVGEQATRVALVEALDRHPVFHFAGHSIADPVDPLSSYLLLAPDDTGKTVLHARDLAELELSRVRLVVLSSCGSLSVEDSRVYGISGLARAFLDAGASAVVASLWPVEDLSAQTLLTEFHKQLKTTGSAEEALREAQLAAIRAGSAPSNWAGFQVIGAFEFRSQTEPMGKPGLWIALR